MGALARTHRKKSLPIGGRQEKETKSIKDPNRLQTIGPNLGDYTQWVRLHAPTGRKSPDLRTARERKGEKYLNRLRTIGPNLGDYTQWVRSRAPTGRKVSRSEDDIKRIKETHRVIAVEESEVLDHGVGVVFHPIVCHRHGAMRSNREAVRGVGLSTDVPGARVLRPKLVHSLHLGSGAR